MSKFHNITFEQKIPVTMDQAWDFFSNPENLSKITPPQMGFLTTSKIQTGKKMYAGQIITYKVSPILSIKLNWMTEITQVSQNSYFIDEQRFGPYSLWHHQHHFEEIPGGIIMTDIINYVLPMGFLGNIANMIFVKNQLKGIFEYRKQIVVDLFGKF